MVRVDLHSFSRNSKAPLHRQLADLMRQAIRDGVYRPGERVEPERQFIDEGELSYPTVARAFRQLADEGLITRRVGSGTYIAEQLPTSPRKLKKVGVFYWRLDTPFFAPIKRGLEVEARRHDIDLHFLATLSHDGEDHSIETLEKQKVDGIVGTGFGSEVAGRDLRRLTEARMPVVMIDAALPQLWCDSVMINNEHGAHQIARHLLALGHERIALITTRGKYPQTNHASILAGIRAAFDDVGAADAPDPRHVILPTMFHETDDPAVRSRVCALWNDPKTAPTAVVCETDGTARVVRGWIASLNLRVPQDVSITGFGDWPEAMHLDPPLTTAAWPLQRAGREAIRRLIHRAERPDDFPVKVMLDTALVIRQSTGQVARSSTGNTS